LITGHRKHLAPSSDGANFLAAIWNLSRTLIHVLCVFRLFSGAGALTPLRSVKLSPGDVWAWRRLPIPQVCHLRSASIWKKTQATGRLLRAGGKKERAGIHKNIWVRDGSSF
jgi:hypothetical protein